MARFLALDWDHGQVHLVSANVDKGGVKIQHAEVWAEERIPNLAEAEDLGRWLREKLKEKGIAPAPLLACVGRDRVILRDVRYPPVPPHEEPAIVRFQVTKELNDSPDEVVIDYTPTGESNGEKRALALLMRQELLTAYRNLAKAAGLKLSLVAPRAFGSAACLRHMLGSSLLTPPPDPPDAPVAMLVIAGEWAEFCVLKDDQVVFARSLTVGDGMAAEVQRNIRVLGGQTGQRPIGAVYVAGDNEHADLRHTLQDLLGMPVYPLDPLQGAAGVAIPAGARGGFTAAVGMLFAESERRPHAINFVQPRQPKPPVNPRRKLILVGSLAAVVVVAVAGFLIASAVMRAQRNNREWRRALADLEKEESELQPVAKNYDAVQDWLNTHVNCLDEFYDTTAMDPDIKEMRITSWSVAPPRTVTTTRDRDRNKKDADKEYVGTITIKGKARKELTDKLRDIIKSDANYNLVVYELPGPEQDFSMVIDVKKRELTGFRRKLEAIAAAKPKPEREVRKNGNVGAEEEER